MYPWGVGGASPHGSIIKGDPNWSPEASQKLVWSSVVVCLLVLLCGQPMMAPFLLGPNTKAHLLPVLAPRTHWSWHYRPPSGALASQAPFPWGEAGLEAACRAQHSLPAEQLAPSPPTTFHWAFELTEELNFFKWNEKPRRTIQICLWRFVLKNFKN